MWRLSSCCAALAVVAMGSMAFGQPQADLRPVNNGLYRSVDAPVVAGAIITGNKIAVTQGGGRVEMELLASDWGTSICPNGGTPGPCTLGACQATIDSTGYLGANASPISGVDLNPLGNDLTPTPVERAQGAFIAQSACSTSLRDCTSGQAPCAGPEGFCVPNSRWVVANLSPIAVLSLVGLNYEYGAVNGTSTGRANVPAAQAAQFGYFGSLILEVPLAAATTYTICFVDNINFTFFNDDVGLLIPDSVLNPGQVKAIINCGQVEVITGSCCTDLGPAGVCTNNVTQAQCNALPSTNAKIFRAGQACPPVGPDCPACTNVTQCNDPVCAQPPSGDNLCTSQVCTAFECVYTTLYNTLTQCCNPNTGTSTTIDDGDPCTTDVCDPCTGIVGHPGSTGNACNDQLDCTTPDTCNAGVCEGVDVNTVPCTTDADCPLGTCGTAVAGFCECSEETPLCIEYTAGPHPDGNCYNAGSAVSAQIAMGAGSQNVTGGQFRIVYDNACLDFVSIGPCAGDTTFTNVIQASANESTGVIFYAMTINPNTVVVGGPNGNAGPYDLGCINFIKLADCDECDVCFEDLNPQLTILTNDEGNRVPLDNCLCSKDIRTAGVVTLNTPPGAMVNADCGQTFASVTWATPNASDTCDGVLELDCTSQNVGGAPSGHLINNGGIFAQGKTFFTCTATNTCGRSKTNVWTVMVSDNQTLDVEVHLQPVMNNVGVFNRAITFELYNDCASDPVEECAVLQFQGPFNFPGHGRATLKVDKGNFLCMTARDNLHTLRSIVTGDDLSCVNNHWTAIFKGDPIQGGNWLIGGNLDAKKADATYGDVNTINILDFGMLMFEFASGAAYPPRGDTTCTTASPHGDINADGAVDNLDYAFLVENFLKNSKGLCCPAGAGVNPESNPLTEISVKELRRIGYGAAVVADLNHDGMVNVDDMNAYMNGAMPVPQVKPIRGDKGRGTR